MHREARDFVARTVDQFGPFYNVVEFGSRDVNGGVRDLFPNAKRYVGVDIAPGRGVDVVADAAAFNDTGFDVVVCCEVLEHTPNTLGVLRAAWRALIPGGLLVLTCATTGREPHSAVDGGTIRAGEHYENVTARTLEAALSVAGFPARSVEVHDGRGDLYCTATW